MTSTGDGLGLREAEGASLGEGRPEDPAGEDRDPAVRISGSRVSDRPVLVRARTVRDPLALGPRDRDRAGPGRAPSSPALARSTGPGRVPSSQDLALPALARLTGRGRIAGIATFRTAQVSPGQAIAWPQAVVRGAHRPIAPLTAAADRCRIPVRDRIRATGVLRIAAARHREIARGLARDRSANGPGPRWRCLPRIF